MGADAGTLSIMCGGDAAALARAAPALDAMGDPAKRFHCGPVGLGLVAKLVNNLLVAIDLRRHRRGARAWASARASTRRSPARWSWAPPGTRGSCATSSHASSRATTGPGFTMRNLLKDLGHARDLDERAPGDRATRPAACSSGSPPTSTTAPSRAS